MEKEKLMRMINELGYPLFEVSINANEVLAGLVKSRDPRLWQGFPVVLANMLKNEWFDYQTTLSYLEDKEDQGNFHTLIVMSLALYSHIDLDPSISDYLNSLVQIDKNLVPEFLNSFSIGSAIPGLESYLSSEKVVETFKNYYTPYDEWNYRDYLVSIDEADLEYALSQIFSTRQKDILKKRLMGDKLTKTEREYYSRVVKKKLMALANTSLHQIANKLIKE
jgi:hypothetical protein